MFQVFLLNIRSFQCNFEIFLNEVPVFVEYSDNFLSFEVNVNVWLRSKENFIKVRLLPMSGKNILHPMARVEAEITNLMEDHSNYEKSKRISLLTLQTYEEKNQGGKEMAYFEITKHFFIPDNFELLWEKGLTFQLDKRESENIHRLYRGIHQMFKEKNLDGIMSVFKKKNETCAKALNENKDIFIFESREALSLIINDSNNQLWPIEQQILTPFLYAKGKLCALKNQLNQHPILFYNQNENSTTFIEIYLMQDLDKSLISIR